MNNPVDELLLTDGVTEIIVNSFDRIYYEKAGQLFQYPQHFNSERDYLNVIEQITQQAGTYLNREKPFVEMQTGRARYTLIFSELSGASILLCVRIQPSTTWSLRFFLENRSLTETQCEFLKELVHTRQNFLIVGSTSSGKTSLMQALLNETSALERSVILEDTRELKVPNAVSACLLARPACGSTLAAVDLNDLFVRALRLRPDRLIIGEIRGSEAKALLLALSSGHRGSFASLHANSAKDALLRLEMLIQMGATEWNAQSIRRLMASSIQYIVVLEKIGARRCLKEVSRIESIEDGGLTLEKIL